MAEQREIIPFAASDATVHSSTDGQTASVWFAVQRGWLVVTLPLDVARSLEGQVREKLGPPPQAETEH